MADQNRTASHLPPTVNFHLIAACNYSCQYCYATFENRSLPQVSYEEARQLLAQFDSAGARRVTFAGGEPTLRPDLPGLLRTASELGLITSVVTNGSRVDGDWLEKNGPWLRWLTLSLDSVVPEEAARLGRTGKRGPRQPKVVRDAAAAVQAYNSCRPPGRRVRLKLNITVTAVNAGEDPSELIRSCRPERVKLLQMLHVEGENDSALALSCADDDFAEYVERVRPLAAEGITVVGETAEAMDGSYAMVDPEGRFYQRVNGRYRRSEPILEAGVTEAWRQVGGFDSEAFVARGGNYDDGVPALGNEPIWIAVEGLDGTGKSTTVARLAEHLGAVIVRNPPTSLAHERRAADSLPPEERRAWYLRANVVAAAQARAHTANGRPVVMDRSVASTLAFAAAEQGRVASDDDWPSEIPRPDVLVLLDLDETHRQVRIGTRPSRTTEESRLDSDAPFRARVLAGYRALGAVPVDASGTVAEVVAGCVQASELTEPAT